MLLYTQHGLRQTKPEQKNDDDSVVLMCRTCRARMIFNYVDLVGAIEQDYHCPRIGWMMMNKVWNKCKNNEQIRN